MWRFRCCRESPKTEMRHRAGVRVDALRSGAIVPGVTRLALPLAGKHEPEIPLYTGDLDRDAWELMRGNLAEEITGGLSYPQKMDTPAWGISAARCAVGTKLREVVGSACESCYAMKGTFRASNVTTKMERAYQALFDPRWTPAMYGLIRFYAKERFRFFHSGDFQGENHFKNIMTICAGIRDMLFWIPTREAQLVREHADCIPENAIVRLSAAMIDGPAPNDWPHTSTVVSDHRKATCPSSVKGGNCSTHGCTACWSDKKNVAYVKH